jgi:Tfp pilus assembly protein PilF
VSEPAGFEAWLKGMLQDSGDATLERWIPRLPGGIGAAEMLVLRETGYMLMRDGSVAATWRLVRLRAFVAMLARQQISGLEGMLMMIWRELELGGAGPAGTAAQILNYRGCLLAEQERFGSAVAHFGAAIDADPDFVPAYLNRVRSQLELDRPQDARADAEAAVARDPQYPRARFTARLVQILITMAADRPPMFALLAAAHGLLDYLRTYDRPLRPREVPDESMWDESAITPLPRPAASASAEEWNHVGVVDGRIGRYAEATEAFESALSANPAYSRARFNLARAQQMAGDHQRAVANVTKLIQDGTGRPEEYQLRARSFRALWRIEEARADDAAAAGLESQPAARRPPDLPDVSDLLRAMAEQPVDLQPWQPEDVEGAAARLEWLHRRGRHHEGLELLSRLAQRPAPTPALQARLHEQRAAILVGLDRSAEAAEQYSAALALLADGSADEIRVRCLESRAGCYPDPADDRRAADLRAALLLTIRIGGRPTEGRLRVWLARDAEARGCPNAAASWYQSALSPAREAEDWASIVQILDRCAEHATRAGRHDDAAASRDARDQTVREAGDLAFLGGAAPARVDLLKSARDILVAEAPSMPILLDDSDEGLTAVLDHADWLRREERQPAAALPCYYAALALCMQRDDPDELAGCLNGMGSAFETLAGDAAADSLRAYAGDGDDIVRSIHDVPALVATAGHALVAGQAGVLTRCAQAAYRWALEEMRRVGDLARQAMQVSNLAVIEARLGNLDTAARYDRWALGVHTRSGTDRQVMVDLGHLLTVAERLGDDESAARLRSQWQELHDASKA